MVTLITDKLRNSSLEDVTFSEYIPYQTRSKTKALHSLQVHPHHTVFSGINKNGSPSLAGIDRPSQNKILDRLNDTPSSPPPPPPQGGNPSVASPGKDIPGSDHPGKFVNNDMLSITPPAPPMKRHCRSFSAGEVVENRTKGKWKPRASKIWKPVRHKSGEPHSSHSPLPMGFSGGLFPTGFGSGSAVNLTLNEYSTPPESPVPRPASATSWDGTISAGNAFRPVLCASPKLRSMSVSEGKILPESSGSFCSVDSSASADSLPERKLRGTTQLRCRSQPCVSERKGGKKRRREEEVRPKLDLFKMEEARLPFDDWVRRSKQNTDSKRHSKSAISNPTNQRPRRQLNNNKYMHKHSKSLTLPTTNCDEFMGRLQTIASSPRSGTGDCNHTPPSSIMITPTSSPTKDLLLQESANTVANTDSATAAASLLTSGKLMGATNKRLLPANVQHDSSDDDDDEMDRLVGGDDDDTVIFAFDADLNDLDLEQIEKF